MDINASQYTAAQLRSWLHQLNLPTTGTKNALVLRLNEIPIDERGECPVDSNTADSNAINERTDSECVNEEINVNVQNNGGKQMRVVETRNEEQMIETIADDMSAQTSGENERNDENDLLIMKREIEILRKEKELLVRENEFLKMKEQYEKDRCNSVSAAVNEMSNRVGDNLSSDSNNVTNSGNTVSYALLKELLPEYEGVTCPEVWISQIKNISTLYKVDDSTLRALLMGKVKGKAQVWLHSRSNFMLEKLEDLFGEMIDMFKSAENKLVIRRNFESYKWEYNASFTDYFNGKVNRASKLVMEEEELIDYIIEGIPDENLKNHAIMQCYKNKAQLLQAFSKIQLKEPTTPKTTTKSDVKLRCYNCNSFGHYASECRKPKREHGACFACGSMDHRVAVCPEKKNALQKVKNNDFLRNIKISLNNNFNNFFYIECLLDSGSPVSFVRESYIAGKMNFKDMRDIGSFYFGINFSKLNTLGKCLFYVFFENKVIELDILIVADNSTSYNCVLGRDFLEKANLVLVQRNKGDRDYLINNVIETIMSIDCVDDGVELNIGKEIDYANREELNNMFHDCYVRPERPVEPKVRSEIKLVLENAKPFSCTPRRLSYDEKQRLQIILDEYLEKGYIRPSESEFVSPIVLVRKKTGDLRMCVDYRVLNKMTSKDCYPIPLIDDLLDRLANRKYFTKLDLRNGFFHVYVEKESVKYTSFVTPLGQYEFLRMPFGLKNAPSVFQRFVNRIFSDMVRDGRLIIYLDDIMIATADISEHFLILKEVFNRLVENRLELRLDKCEFLQTTVTYLGYKIDGQGIGADDRGLRAIRDFPLPTNVHAVQSFLGLCSYFRRFVKDFSTIAKPLYDLIRKDRKFSFGQIELEAFELLKGKLLASPVLALYDPRDDTELHCDASSIGFGAVLLQKKQDGKMHPVFYFSKRTTEAESKYHSFELETLAIVNALKRFRIYLQGKKFKIVTDCNSLTMTLNKKDLNPRIARWGLELQNYDYTLEHRAGSRMQHVDALSRCLSIMVIESNTFEENLVICQNKDAKLLKLKDELQKRQNKWYEMRNGVIYRKSSDDVLLFCVPEDMEQHVLYKYHDEMGHVGVDKTTELISKSYWFPKIRDKALRHIQNCLKCIAYSSKNGKEEGFLNNIPKCTIPFDTIHIDHYGPVDNGRPLKHILVIIDAGTKFVRLYPTKTTNTREVIIHLKEYFRSYSRPRCVVSDRGSAFTSAEFREFLEDYNIQHIKVATGSPQANGQVERVNRSIGPMIAKLVHPEEGIYWDTILDRVEHTLNNTVHRTIGNHPSVMLFGVGQRGKVIDSLRETLVNELGDEKRVDRAKIREAASAKQIALQTYNRDYVNARRRPPIQYSVGDYVMIRNFDSHTGVSRKLIPKFKGPYKVSKVLRNDRYLLEDIEGFQTSRNPYKGVWAVGNIRPWLRNHRSSNV